MLFNKQSTEERVNEIKQKYIDLCHDWQPRQTNGYQLYKDAGNDWTKVDISKFKTVDWYSSWKDMPQKAIDYLVSLPEFDAGIFKEITGLDVTKKPDNSEKKAKILARIEELKKEADSL